MLHHINVSFSHGFVLWVKALDVKTKPAQRGQIRLTNFLLQEQQQWSTGICRWCVFSGSLMCTAHCATIIRQRPHAKHHVIQSLGPDGLQTSSFRYSSLAILCSTSAFWSDPYFSRQPKFSPAKGSLQMQSVGCCQQFHLAGWSYNYGRVNSNIHSPNVLIFISSSLWLTEKFGAGAFCWKYLVE